MKHNSVYIKIATGVSLVLVGTLIIFSDYIKEKRDVVFSDMNLALSELQKEIEKEAVEEVENIQEKEPLETATEEEQEIKEGEVKSEVKELNYESYLGTLNIPKIKLTRGFYSKVSKLNKVSINIYVLPQSDYPDVEAGNLMLAAHSGTANVSFFKKLYLLDVGDEAIINYNNKKYIYKIDKIYEVQKNGAIRVLRNTTKTTLTLVTCTRNNNNHQTVYIAYLDRIE